MSVSAKRCRAVFERLEDDLVKLSSKPRAESVHRFRTGTRRLQILLNDLSPKLGRSDKKLLRLLGRIRKRAGKVRDLDVQLAALRSLKVPREPRRKTQMMNLLIEQRGKQEKKLRKEVDKKTVDEILTRLKRAGKDFHPEASPEPLTVARKMLDRIDANTPVTEPLLHQYRILSKRARYAAEFAGKSQEAQKFIVDIKHLQDVLGDWHDWFTLTRTATAHLGETKDSPLVAELHNVTGAKFRHAVTLLSQMRGTGAVKPNAAVATSTSRAPQNRPVTSAA
ncbi:MAG: CHAD domain-containing protein [Candidatus Sulfotelmatobacter sp.]